MKKKLTYMLAVTSDYVFAAGNIVLGLIRHRPQKDFDVAIFYDEMCDADKKIFESTGICHLYQYTCPEKFEKAIRTRCPKFNDENFAKHFSFLKFAKFEIFTLLEQYENAVWLDADMAIQDDTSSIIDYGPFAITIDKDWTVQNNFTAPIPNYDMKKDGVCSAVFLVSDALPRYKEMRQWCYDMAEECSPYFKNIDQGIFNLLLQHFDIKFKFLPLYEWQCITGRNEATEARIVHFGTRQKVWSSPEILSAFPEWFRIHKKWLSLGGSDFTRPSGWKEFSAYEVFRQKNEKIKKLEQERDHYKNVSLNRTASYRCPDYKVCLFGLPIWKKKSKGSRDKYYLFGFIHLITVKHKD